MAAGLVDIAHVDGAGHHPVGEGGHGRWHLVAMDQHGGFGGAAPSGHLRGDGRAHFPARSRHGDGEGVEDGALGEVDQLGRQVLEAGAGHHPRQIAGGIVLGADRVLVLHRHAPSSAGLCAGPDRMVHYWRGMR